MTDQASEIEQLVSGFRSFAELPTTPLRFVKIHNLGILLETLHMEYEDKTLPYGELKKYLTRSTECETFLERYCAQAGVEPTQKLPVKAELRSLIAKFAEYTLESDNEDTDAVAPTGDSMPPTCAQFITFAQGQPDLKRLDLVFVSKTLQSSEITDDEKIEFCTNSKKTGAFQKKMSEICPGDIKSGDMGVRVELCKLIQTFAAKPLNGRSNDRSSAPYVAAAVPPKNRALNYAASTTGFLLYCKERNGGEAIMAGRGFNLPDWNVLRKMLDEASDEDRIEALIAVGIDHPTAEKMNGFYKDFVKAHDDHTPSYSYSYGSGSSSRKVRKADDDDDSDDDYSSGLGGGYMSREDQMEAYLKGHPEAKDNAKKNKNIDFYRGAKAMKPYDCFIDDFHRLPAANTATASAAESSDLDVPNSGVVNANGTNRAATTGSRSSTQWAGNYSKLEIEHSYIQWLFPIQEGGGMSSTSQPLQRHEIVAINKDKAVQTRFRRSYEVMLDFFGMKLVDRNTGKIARSADYKDRYHNLNTSSHNYLRITRILKCLGEVGFEHFKMPWIEFFMDEVYVQRELPNCSTSLKDYWMKTLRSPEQRAQVAQLRDKLIAEHGDVKPTWATSTSWGVGGGWFDDAEPVAGARSAEDTFKSTPGEEIL